MRIYPIRGTGRRRIFGGDMAETRLKNNPDIERLDRNGGLAGAAETQDAWLAREARLAANARVLRKRLAQGGEIVLTPDIAARQENLLDPAVFAPAEKLTAALYDFRFSDAVGFYLSRGVGTLWAGCAYYDPERECRFFLLREEFRSRSKYLGLYSREELIAHETCHLVRAPLDDDEFDEYFAYQTSSSRLRRYLGNCFVRPRDAYLFVVPSLLLFGARMAELLGIITLPIAPFAGLLATATGYLLYRNQRSRNFIRRAKNNLRGAGIAKPLAVLFRCTAREIKHLATLSSDKVPAYIKEQARENVRWRVIAERFTGVSA